MPSMGLGVLVNQDTVFKRKFRWMFNIDLQGTTVGINALPPTKGSRPSLSFKEGAANHVNETIYYPMKPDWKPINVSVYDTKGSNNPVFDWLRKLYDPTDGSWRGAAMGFIKQASLELFNGCGDRCEEWIFQDVWPQTIDFGDLDMQSSEVVVIDLTLRYSRAFII